MRKLASIQRIKSLEKIEGADAIEKATVLGWQLVVKKGEFSVGDLCVYCEIDSVFPDKPEFAFLQPRGMRIRTIRLRGQISQGICFPVSILPPTVVIEEGTEVTEQMGIQKYEPPVPAHLEGVIKGTFPSFIPKTDETRVQVLQDVLDKYVGEKCFVTEKLDGTSVTYYLNNGEFGVCSRNLDLLEDEKNSLWKIARELGIEEKLRTLNFNIALQGEIIGEGVQGNKYGLRGQTVYFFNAFEIDKYRYLDFEEFVKLINRMEVKHAPVIDDDYKLENDIPSIINKSMFRSTLLDKAWAEGIVIRPLKEKSDAMGRISFKAINPEFLLKYGE